MTLETILHQQKTLQPTKKLHELLPSELSEYWVSEHSQFKHPIWYFKNTTPGSAKSTSTLNWGMELHDGSHLIDDQHTLRLHWAKILLLTLLTVPAKERKPAPGGMKSYQAAFKWILSWMAEQGFHKPDELTPEVIEHYVTDLPHYMAEQRDDEEIGVSSANDALKVLLHLWNQRLYLAKMGIKSLVSHPFQGQSNNKVAKSIATKANGWIKPIPDEVAIPLLNKAAWFLGTPSADIIRLLDVVRDPLSGTIVRVSRGRGTTRSQKAGEAQLARLARVRRFLDTFEFSIIPGDDIPWHEPLRLAHDNKKGRKIEQLTRIWELFESVRTAAAITVMGTSGMRISELMGIKAGTDKDTGLPLGVRIEVSITGLYEWFVIRSVISKAVEGLPREVDWILGMRPKGSKEVPLAVRALLILNKIHEPWQVKARTDRLILSMRSKGGILPSRSATLGARSSQRMLGSMKLFISRWIDLSNLADESARKTEDNDLVPWRESAGTIFTTHMLRKSWAAYALACDSRLLPAIQMQFHHLSLAMTEGGYIGRNPLLVESLDSVSRQKRNSMIYELVTGHTALAGRMGEQLEQATTALRTEVANLPTSEKWQRVIAWADTNDLQLFFSAHATCCPTRTSEMRCQDEAQTPIWSRQHPNTATREPSLCAGCACAVMDSSHESFWSERYVKSWVSVKQNEKAGMNMADFRVIRFRADQAGSILRKFGVDLSVLDKNIEYAVEAGYA